MAHSLLRRLGGVLAAAVLLAALVGARVATRDPDIPAEEIVLTQQNQELENLVARAEKGRLLDFEQVLVVVDQHLVQDLVGAAVPLEGDIGHGFHVRIERAEASFGDGVALLLLHGRASVVGKSASATMAVYGGLDVVSLDSASGILRCNVKVFGVETTEADVLGMDRPVRRLTDALTEGGLASLLPAVEIPVSIHDQVSLPSVQTRRLRIDAANVPLQVSVGSVTVFGGKLWVGVRIGLEAQAPPQVARTEAKP